MKSLWENKSPGRDERLNCSCLCACKWQCFWFADFLWKSNETAESRLFFWEPGRKEYEMAIKRNSGCAISVVKMRKRTGSKEQPQVIRSKNKYIEVSVLPWIGTEARYDNYDCGWLQLQWSRRLEILQKPACCSYATHSKNPLCPNQSLQAQPVSIEAGRYRNWANKSLVNFVPDCLWIMPF